MIEVQIDVEEELRKIEAQLNDLPKGKAKKVLKTAINKTAAESTKMLLKKAQETFAIKSGGFKGKSGAALKTKKATTSKLTATLNSEGTPIELFKFKTSPSKFLPQRHEKGDSETKGKVKKKNTLSVLEIDDRMAFVVQFSNGHTSIAQRTTKKRFPIKTLYSISVPQMIGDEDEVYGLVEPHIEEMLQKFVLQEIDKIKAAK